MTDLVYLKNSYQKKLNAKITNAERKGNTWLVVLDKTIFYPQGGGQPSDKGEIIGISGKAVVKHVFMRDDTVLHECAIQGDLKAGDQIECILDWKLRYHNMKVHSAGHIVHEAVVELCSGLIPVKGDHGKHAYIEYTGSIPIDKKYSIEKRANEIVSNDVPIVSEFISLEQLIKRAPWYPPNLPTHKPLRIIQIGSYPPIPDGGTQIASTKETGEIQIADIENTSECVRVHYAIVDIQDAEDQKPLQTAQNFISLLLELQSRVLSEIENSDMPADQLRLHYLGRDSEFSQFSRSITQILPEERQQAGGVLNEVKLSIENALGTGLSKTELTENTEWVDVTAPGTKPPVGHLHIVSQAIMEITGIFEKIGFTRVRHPEIDWDWYPFESLNMPPNHPARDEWETFFIEYPGKPGNDPKKQKIVLTPHTSNGQVREMEKGKLPIRMINIAKCYRRQSDVSHTPMFHQFEGLYIDKNVSIGHLKGVFDYFVKQFYGSERKIRLRPFHFQFTEPSFEVDITCGICLGSGTLADGKKCRLCKEGWLEMAGSGMVHPIVLRNGGIDPDIYSGFAFGWGVERAYMMKSGIQIDDLRLIYSNDLRFLEQF